MLKCSVSAILLVAVLSALLGIVHCQAGCEDNQHYMNCGTRCPDNCTHRNNACEKICAPGCFCNEGFIMEDSLTRNCIPLTLCDSCKGNTRYSSCSTDCPPTCDNRKPDFCNDMCFIGCVCKDGYIHLTSEKTSECVLPSQCP